MGEGGREERDEEMLIGLDCFCLGYSQHASSTYSYVVLSILFAFSLSYLDKGVI